MGIRHTSWREVVAQRVGAIYMLAGLRKIDIVAYVFAVADDDACDAVSAHGVEGCRHINLVSYCYINACVPLFQSIGSHSL